MQSKIRLMFDIVTRTWNPITGCYHMCSYCYARKLVEKRLRFCNKKYADGFKPKYHPDEFNKYFRPREFVFVCDMGDLFGEWVPFSWIYNVIEHVSKFPLTTFLFLTKNPSRYPEFIRFMPGNVILGATIETDLDEIAAKYSKAPEPSTRLTAMRFLKTKYPNFTRMVSIEPIMKFSDRFAELIADIEPSFVYVGYDNHNNNLLEPDVEETMELIDALKECGIEVRVKTIPTQRKLDAYIICGSEAGRNLPDPKSRVR